MVLSRFVRGQLIIFTVLTLAALSVMGVYYMQIPAMVGIGRYTVTVQLPTSGGLYETSNVSYRGATVGTVVSVDPTREGASAVLSLDSSVKVPVDVTADVHSRSAIGEQYVDLVPTSDAGPYLADGAVIPVDRTSVPQDIAPMIDTVNNSLAAIPEGKLSSLLDESYRAFNGTGPDLQRLLDSSNLLVGDANENSEATTTLIDDMGPFLAAQAESTDSITAWAHNINGLTSSARQRDQSIRTVLQQGPEAADEATKLFQDLKPTLPLLLDNLTSLGQVAVTYNASLEQLLVILPQGMSVLQTMGAPNKGTSNRPYLSFNLGNLNSPPPCTTGFMPPETRRDGSAVDAPTRTTDDIYCALPQDSEYNVRGARNLPCMDNPGKRAPTVAICKSDEPYRPQGNIPWIGNPTPTIDNPLADEANRMWEQMNGPGAAGAPPGEGPSAAPASFEQGAAGPAVATAEYDPDSGTYRGSDGTLYKQANVIAPDSKSDPTWQTMLTAQAG